jgi:DNA-directed RNA polymerase subunit alpha
MDITFKRGRGYVLADDHKIAGLDIGTILVDSQFSPVTRVMYNVEDARVGQDINFDKLNVQVWTNGSMQPAEAVELSAKFLKAHVDLFQALEEEIVEAGNSIPTHNEELVMVAAQKQEAPQKGHLDILIKDLEFSVRSRNCLKKAGIQTLGELVDKKVSALLEIKNFGKKSLKEVREKLGQFNLTLPDDDTAGGIDE